MDRACSRNCQLLQLTNTDQAYNSRIRKVKGNCIHSCKLEIELFDYNLRKEMNIYKFEYFLPIISNKYTPAPSLSPLAQVSLSDSETS